MLVVLVLAAVLELPTGERPSPAVLIGGALIVVGGVVIQAGR